MKKLVSASVVLTCFAVSMILFQISCQEESIAKEQQTQNKFLYSLVIGGQWQYWIANVDGTNHQQIHISLPSPLRLSGHIQLTQDGETLIFAAFNPGEDEYSIYSLTINGTTLKKLLDAAPATQLDIHQTF